MAAGAAVVEMIFRLMTDSVQTGFRL
jgi:hypothetical protein